MIVLFGLVLTGLVISGRFKNEVWSREGKKHELPNRIRAHGNLIETAPLFLITLLLIEMNGASSIWLHGLGLVFLIARIAHAVGMLRLYPNLPFRMVGMALTLVSMFIAALFLLVQIAAA